MIRHLAVLGFLIGSMMFCMVAMGIILATGAMPQDIPKGLGHPQGADHWYDTSCCSKRDCEPVEPGAIMWTPEGYQIRYRTSRGHIAEGFLKHDASGIKFSKDGQEHACAPFAKVVCIYIHHGA